MVTNREDCDRGMTSAAVMFADVALAAPSNRLMRILSIHLTQLLSELRGVTESSRNTSRIKRHCASMMMDVFGCRFQLKACFIVPERSMA